MSKMFSSLSGNALQAEVSAKTTDATDSPADANESAGECDMELLIWLDFYARSIPESIALEVSRTFPKAKLFLSVTHEFPSDSETCWFKAGSVCYRDPDVEHAHWEPEPVGTKEEHFYPFWIEGIDDYCDDDYDREVALAESRVDQLVPEGRLLINLTSDQGAYGCVVPVSWLIEFLRLKEGQSIRKESFAWFNQAPHDREECIYHASVKDSVLSIQVEVGPEALIKRADFPLRNFSGWQSQANVKSKEKEA